MYRNKSGVCKMRISMIVFGSFVLLDGCISSAPLRNTADIQVEIVPHIRHSCELLRQAYASMANEPSLSTNCDSMLINIDFFVAFRNLSNQVLYIPDEEFSIGHSSLELDVQTSDGILTTLKKKPGSWVRNFPAYYALPPGGSVLYPVSIDLRVWDGIPLSLIKTGERYAVRVRFKGGVVLREGHTETQPMEIFLKGVPIAELESDWKDLKFRW